MTDLRLSQAEQAHLAALDQALQDVSQTLAGMYREYEEFTDGRVSMMLTLLQLTQSIDQLRSDLDQKHADGTADSNLPATHNLETRAIS
jgi:hypothetical protein